MSASKAAANNNIPGPNSTVATLVAMFENVGLALNDVVALSGNHILLLFISLALKESEIDACLFLSLYI